MVHFVVTVQREPRFRFHAFRLVCFSLSLLFAQRHVTICLLDRRQLIKVSEKSRVYAAKPLIIILCLLQALVHPLEHLEVDERLFVNEHYLNVAEGNADARQSLPICIQLQFFPA